MNFGALGQFLIFDKAEKSVTVTAAVTAAGEGFSHEAAATPSKFEIYLPREKRRRQNRTLAAAAAADKTLTSVKPKQLASVTVVR